MRILVSLLALLAFAQYSLAQDDHGDTRETATTITTADTLGNLETTEDTDFFSFVVTTAGPHWFYTTGTTDTQGFLSNDAGIFISGGSSFDDTGYRENFRFFEILQPGTYFISLINGGRGNLTGSYTLSIRSPQYSNPFDTPNLPASLDPLGDLDLYRLDVRQTSPYWLFTTGNTNTFGTLYNDSGTRAGGGGSFVNAGAGSNFRFSLRLLPGTYYLLVEAGTTNTGPYTLSQRSIGNAIPFYGPDRESSLAVPGDLDLYQIPINSTSRFWIYSTGATDTTATLYDLSGIRAAGGSSFDNSGAGNNFRFSNTLTPANYLLLVESDSTGNFTGSYNLHLRDPANAIPLTSSGETPHSIGTAGDLDLFTLSSSGVALAFESAGTTDTTATLYDKDGDSVAGGSSFRDAGTLDNFRFSRDLTPGEYYLLVEGQAPDLTTGSYTLQASFSPGNLTRLATGGAVISTESSSQLQITSTGSWEIGDLPSWITPSRTTGTGNTEISLTYAANLSGSSRTSTLNISGQLYTITQRAQGDTTGLPILAQTTISTGSLITIPTEVGVSYQIETSDDMNTWLPTGTTLQGNGLPQTAGFAREEARQFFRAVPQ